MGWPLFYQRWDDLLFINFPFPAEPLEALLPEGLRLDTHQGRAWVTVTPFTISWVRPPLVPPLPLITRAFEVNVRTYVERDGIRGVWFLSLDANSIVTVAAARLTASLPYYYARIRYDGPEDDRHFEASRTSLQRTAARFVARWALGVERSTPAEGSLEAFLAERYVLYVVNRGTLRRGRIAHQRWVLRSADLIGMESTLFEAMGVAAPTAAPLIFAQAEGFEVAVLPLESV